MDLPATFKSASVLPVPGLGGGSVVGDSLQLATYGALLLAL